MREKNKMSYEEFRDAIKETLEKNPEGLSWKEIKHLANLQQKVPNNRWVRWLERDIGLVRKEDVRRQEVKRTIWRLRGQVEKTTGVGSWAPLCQNIIKIIDLLDPMMETDELGDGRDLICEGLRSMTKVIAEDEGIKFPPVGVYDISNLKGILRGVMSK